VAQHHDVADPERHHAELEGGAGAVLEGVVRLVARHEVGDVAHDQELAWRRVEDDLRRDPGIDAADHHDLRPLPSLRQKLVARALARESGVEEGP